MLKELNVDVYFEEQGLHSKQQGSEFYITIYGSIAQSESENISANVIWGKNQAAKEGKAPFFYKNFLGYYKGADGLPAINEEEAKVIRMIYDTPSPGLGSGRGSGKFPGGGWTVLGSVLHQVNFRNNLWIIHQTLHKQ